MRKLNEDQVFQRGLNIGFFSGVICSMAGMYFVFHFLT